MRERDDRVSFSRRQGAFTWGGTTRIYTKTGDSGETGLFGGGRVSKDDPRVDAYGEVDELNAVIGVVRSGAAPADIDKILAELQEQLFTVGAILATPPHSKAEKGIPKIQDEWIVRMEQAMDAFDAELPPLRQFILPGGTPSAAALHLARTICRRAERRVVMLHRNGQVGDNVLVYLNRLSDLLFMLARIANLRADLIDVLWNPPAT